MPSFTRRECFEMLGLPQGSSPDEIKQAYHAKALIYHPDKNKDPEAKAKFQEISEAYQTLQRPQRDPGRRRTYMDSDSDSDSDTDGYIRVDFLELFIIIQQQLLREEMLRRRREEMIMQSMMRDLFSGHYRNPYGISDYDGGFEYRRPNYGFGQRYGRTETETTRPRSTGNSDTRTDNETRRRNQYQTKTSQVHTPNRQSRPTRQSYTSSASSGVYWNEYSRPAYADSSSSGKYSKEPKPAKQEQVTKGQSAKQAAPAYVVNKPNEKSKKQLLAEQSRRQREANEIGKELRLKAKKNMKLLSEKKNGASKDKMQV